MPSIGVLPQKQKSSCPGVEIGQRQVSLESSNSEQVWPLWICTAFASGSGSDGNDFNRICRSRCAPRGRGLLAGSFFTVLITPPLSRTRQRREILPMTALRLTPISAAISRQERPASKWIFRASTRSVVQVCKIEGMSSVPSCDPFGIALALRCTEAAAPKRPYLRFAIVTDGKQSVLDRGPDALLNQRPGNAGDTGAVGALSHKFLEIGNGRKRQGYGYTVSLGFFRGHAKS